MKYNERTYVNTLVQFLQRLNLRTVLKLFTIAVLYYISGKLGLLLALINPSITPIWPPTGIALASFLLFGFSVWPAIFIGAFLVNITTSGSIPASFGIAVGNTLEGILGVYLLVKFAHGLLVFEKTKDIFLFALFALVCTVVSATIGTTSLLLGKSLSVIALPSAWLTWWLGDVGGAVIITPLVILWITQKKFFLWRKDILEVLLMLAVLVCTCLIVFFGVLPFPYLIIPVVVWMAIRRSRGETATAVLILSIITTLFTFKGMGPFYRTANLNASLLLQQLFLGIVSIMTIIIGSVVWEKKKTQEEVEHSQKHFKALIEKSTDGIMLLDAEGSVLYASPSALRILGYSSREFLHKNIMTFIHPQELSKVGQVFQSLVRVDGKSVFSEFRYRHKNGKYIWIEGSGTNLLRDPNVGAIVTNFRDITKQKEIEKRKDDFIAISSHELKTPVTSIQLFSSGLEKLLKNNRIGEAKIFAERISSQTKKLSKLVSDLLDVTKIQSGQLAYSYKFFDLSECVGEAIEQMQELTKSKIILKGNISKNVYGDYDRIFQVITNLLTNAIKYSPRESRVVVTLSEKEKFAQICVKDFGIGINREDLPQIFGRFFRTNEKGKRTFPGLGIGLYISAAIVKKHRGKIWVESKKGKGSIFCFSVPFTSIGPKARIV